MVPDPLEIIIAPLQLGQLHVKVARDVVQRALAFARMAVEDHPIGKSAGRGCGRRRAGERPAQGQEGGGLDDRTVMRASAVPVAAGVCDQRRLRRFNGPARNPLPKIVRLAHGLGDQPNDPVVRAPVQHRFVALGQRVPQEAEAGGIPIFRRLGHPDQCGDLAVEFAGERQLRTERPAVPESNERRAFFEPCFRVNGEVFDERTGCINPLDMAPADGLLQKRAIAVIKGGGRFHRDADNCPEFFKSGEMLRQETGARQAGGGLRSLYIECNSGHPTIFCNVFLWSVSTHPV